MQTTVTFTFACEVPDDVQIGDKLQTTAVVTVHSIIGDLVDVRHFNGGPEWVPGKIDLHVYANYAKFAAVREP